MCAGEGIEDIDDAHDAAVDGYLFPPQPTGVALAIEPFVMLIRSKNTIRHYSKTNLSHKTSSRPGRTIMGYTSNKRNRRR
jgi:hypothetical protein